MSSKRLHGYNMGFDLSVSGVKSNGLGLLKLDSRVDYFKCHGVKVC